MAANMTMANTRLWRRLGWVIWSVAAGLLMLPLVAMQFSSEVDWTGSDFLVMGLMLGLVCASYELAIRVARSNAYVLGAGLAAVNGFLLAWINLAVGIVGNENNPSNWIFFGVLGVALVGAVFTRLRPLNLAHAMEVTALAQLMACVVVLVRDGAQVFVLTGVFAMLWLASAQLFRKAARQEATPVAAPG